MCYHSVHPNCRYTMYCGLIIFNYIALYQHRFYILRYGVYKSMVSVCQTFIIQCILYTYTQVTYVFYNKICDNYFVFSSVVVWLQEHMTLRWVGSVIVLYSKGHRARAGKGHKKLHVWQEYHTCCTRSSGIIRNF